MGGNALKEFGIETRRVDRAEYLEIRDTIISNLKSFFQEEPNFLIRRVVDIPAYRTKESFGDLDLLLETFSGDSYKYVDVINKLFAPKKIAQNSEVYSFDYKDFQVDLILTPTDDFDTSLSYKAWNDLGNLAGRIYKKLGFKYGHKGLSYMFRQQDQTYNVFAETVVSKDIRQILEFADLDADAFFEGFDTVEQMFRWVSSSKYFHKDIYLLHNRNHVSRTRDRKRKIYNDFLKWCAETPCLPEYPWTQMREQDGYAGKPEFLKLALQKFDRFESIYNAIMLRHEQELIVRSKFNGDIVRTLTGKVGKELGHLMQHIICYCGGKDELREFILTASPAEIKIMVDRALVDMEGQENESKAF